VRSIQHGGFYSAKKNTHEQASGAQSNVGWTNTQLNSVNIHIFRYGDLLLMLAEAEAQAGVLDNARLIVNQIRSRAAQTVQGCALPADAKAKAAELAAYPTCGTDPTIASMAVATGAPTNVTTPVTFTTPWATYKIGTYTAAQWPDKATALAAIQAERRLELAMEGQRFFDLRRWGLAQTVLNAYVNGVGGGAEKTRVMQVPIPGDTVTYVQQFTSAEAVAAKHNLFPIPDNQIQLSKVAGASKLTQNPGW
jgi:hypothetical protein